MDRTLRATTRTEHGTRPVTGSLVGRASGFELTEGDQRGAAGIEEALARNRAFAAAGGHQGAVVFPNLRLFVITCLDPRVDPAHFLGLGLGDAMVIRNVGGRVTPEVINDVAFIGQLAETILPDGPLFEVAVIHHTQCGTGRSPTTPSGAATPSGSAPRRARCASTPCSLRPRPSRSTSSACAPRPRSPPASRSRGTSTTWPPASSRPSTPAAVEDKNPRS